MFAFCCVLAVLHVALAIDWNWVGGNTDFTTPGNWRNNAAPSVTSNASCGTTTFGLPSQRINSQLPVITFFPFGLIFSLK